MKNLKTTIIARVLETIEPKENETTDSFLRRLQYEADRLSHLYDNGVHEDGSLKITTKEMFDRYNKDK